MQHFLRFIAWIAALVAGLSFYTAFTWKGGSDLQLIFGSIFTMIFVTALALAEILYVLAQIRDGKQPATQSAQIPSADM